MHYEGEGDVAQKQHKLTSKEMVGIELFIVRLIIV